MITATEKISSGNILIGTDDCFHSLPEGRKLYKCISVDIDIEEGKYSNAFLYFRVSKEWIIANSINHSLMGIMKFDDGISQDLSIILA